MIAQGDRIIRHSLIGAGQTYNLEEGEGEGRENDVVVL